MGWLVVIRATGVELRKTLCAAEEPDLIQTVHGSGYQLKEPV